MHNSLFKKEQPDWFARDLSQLLAKNERFAQKIRIFYLFLTDFPPLYAQEQSAHLLFLMSNLSNLLPLLFTKKQLWAICSFLMSESLFGSQKKSKSLEKPMSKFPTLRTVRCTLLDTQIHL